MMNADSLMLFVVLILLSQSIYWILSIIVKRDGCFRRFIMKQRREREWGGFVNFLNDVYIGLSFAFCINVDVNRMEIKSRSTGVNTVCTAIIGVILITSPAIIVYIVHRRWKSEPVKDLPESIE